MAEFACALGQPRRVETGAIAFGGMALVAAYLLLCALSLIPFLAVPFPPIVDFANHAARLNLACHQAEPAVAAMYHYKLGIIPNLTLDLVNLAGCSVEDPTILTRLVTAASLLLIYASAWLIQRQLFGVTNAFVLLVPALAFNLVTTMGYINFLSGVAVVCLITAIAIVRLDRFKELLLLCNVGGVVLFFCHIFALAIACLVFFGLMLGSAPFSARRVAAAGMRTAALFALPLLLIPFIAHSSHPLSIGYDGKLRCLVALGIAPHANLAGIAMVLLPVLYLLVRRGLVTFHPLLRMSLAVLGVYVLIMPSQIGDAVDVDSRSLIALAYLALATLRPAARARELTIAIGLLAAGSVAFQLWAMATVWVPFSHGIEEFRTADRLLPANSPVLSVGEDNGPAMTAISAAYNHVASYATIDRRIFNPLEFTGVGMQPLYATARFLPFDTPASQPFSPHAAAKLAAASARTRNAAQKFGADFALRWPQRFDYVIYYHFGGRSNFDPADLTEVHRGSYFSILKVRKPTAAVGSASRPTVCLRSVYQTCPRDLASAAGEAQL